MSDQIKEAFDALLVEMEQPPTWNDLVAGPVSPPRRQFNGPLIALGAAVVTVLLVGVVALLRSEPDPAPLWQHAPGEWTELATFEMAIPSGAIVEVVDSGLVVLQTASSTLVGFDGSVKEGEVAPLPIHPGCCGSTFGIPMDDSLVLIDAYRPGAWVLDTATMTWSQIGDRQLPAGDLLGWALIDADLYVVRAAPRVAGADSQVEVLSLATGTWRSIEGVPSGISVGGVTSDGHSLYVAGVKQDTRNNVIEDDRNPVVFRYTDDGGWTALPDIPIDGQAATVTWVEGAGLLAWNYGQESALLEGSGEWVRLDDVPMEFFECYPRSIEVDGGVVGICGGLAYFDAATRTWTPIPMRQDSWYVSDGEALYELAAGSNEVTLSRLTFTPPPDEPEPTTTSFPTTTESFSASVTVDHLGWDVVDLPDGVSAANGVMVWSGEEILFWGGETDASTGMPEGDPGMAYDPATQTWRSLAPSPKGVTYGATAVWTGSEMIVCCGARTADETVAYDPATDSWRILADTPTRGEYAESVWTGEVMLVVASTGVASYDPATDVWTEFPAPPTPLERINEVALVGSELMVWPNIYGRTTGLGMTLDLETGEWGVFPEPPAWPAMLDIESVGDGLIIWGGLPARSGGSERAVGSWWDGATRTWRPLPEVLPEPDGCECNLGSQTLFWTGQELLVWAGMLGTGLDPDETLLLSFDPASNQWTLVDKSPTQWGGQALMAGDRVVVRTYAVTGDEIVISPPGWRSQGTRLEPAS